MAGLFPPQEQHWGLDSQLALTPQAAERVCREAAHQPFDQAAQSLNADWVTHYDGKQMQRWAQHAGTTIVQLQEAERQGYKKGQRPAAPANEHTLLAVGMDGGRWQGRTKDPESQSRWREDKVLTISSYAREPAEKTGDDPEPVRLITSYVATRQGAGRFGELARIEAERRGLRQAAEVVVIGDGAAWIDTIAQEHFASYERIIDYYHVFERLNACAQALYPVADALRKRLTKRLETQLYGGKTALLIGWLAARVRRAGPPRASDPEGHPRRVLAENLTYLERHRGQMDYPRYRKNGWPIGSGVTESGVKLFNKRVKGTEQFWADEGIEAMLALRALWLSGDQRWQHYWLKGTLLRAA